MMRKASMCFFLLCFALYHYQVLSVSDAQQESNLKESYSLELDSVIPNPKKLHHDHPGHSDKQHYHYNHRRHHVYHQEIERDSQYIPMKATKLYHHHHNHRHHQHHHHHHHKRAHHHVHAPDLEVLYPSKSLMKTRVPYQHYHHHHHTTPHYHILDPMEASKFPLESAVAAPHPHESRDHRYHHRRRHHHHHHQQHKKSHHNHHSKSPQRLNFYRTIDNN
ncbi:uncharacterized protein [Spinacia oleracea]|uniref:Histidine-rich glycoprotein n=1 Tax=Spinacia oleracea TaxID=3562 RepID=A0A9R0ILZ5_SPIOL|nr:uncharacterized protein LOC110791361 [Spinacia oleracea]